MPFCRKEPCLQARADAPFLLSFPRRPIDRPVVELFLGILSIFRRETFIPTEASAEDHVL